MTWFLGSIPSTLDIAPMIFSLRINRFSQIKQSDVSKLKMKRTI